MKLYVTFEWDEEELGPDWLNTDNLKRLLYTETTTKEELLKVESARLPPF